MSKQQPHILFVSAIAEDRRSVSSYLSIQQFRTTAVGCSRTARHEFEANTIDAVVLDVANDDGTGAQTCRRLRECGVVVPIILFTSGGDPIDRIVGLELGADDCIDKPVNEKELVARIRARLRIIDRSDNRVIDCYSFAGLLLDVSERRVTRPNGSALPLTSGEFDLLVAFVKKAGRKLSRPQLLDLTERRVTDDSTRSIDVLVSRLRRKLFAVTNNEHISTIRNGGYQFTSEVNAVHRDQANSPASR
ncbi:response regulator transcription factor [Bradyrhizobium liaoningense]|uniref:response regulator transcription factor n=1 Tax=Bradyrhizobium liaoningense TaxID=43992 RepID=UPI001BA4B9AB|nr:response regulator transcription factor [Bradyrhizobium liaoningense]MBR0706936.1 response regulator transcription factor [Bradyrhizobium liaoningense]